MPPLPLGMLCGAAYDVVCSPGIVETAARVVGNTVDVVNDDVVCQSRPRRNKRAIAPAL